MTCSERPLAQPSKAGRLAGSYDVPLPGPHCSRTRGAAQCSRALALAATLASLRETPSGAARFRGRCLLPRAVPRPGHHQIILSLAVARARCHVGLGKGRCGGKRGGRDSEGRCRAQRGPEAGFAALDRSWWTKCSCPLYGYSLRYTVPPSAWTTGTWKGRGSGSGSSVSTLDGRRPIPLGSAYGSRWASSCCGPALREPVSVEKWRKERNPTVLLQHAMAEAEGLSVRANASQSFIGACGPRSVMRPSPRRAAAAADDAGLRRGRHGGQDPLPPHRHLQIADSGRLHEAHVRIERVPRPGGHVQVDAEVGDCPPPAATARCAAVLTPRCRTRHEGVRGLYRGFPVAFWGSGPAACIYFTSYEVRRAVLALTPPHAVERWHSFSRDASAADQGLPLARPGHRRPRLRPPLCRRYGGRVDQVRPAPRALGGLWGGRWLTARPRRVRQLRALRSHRRRQGADAGAEADGCVARLAGEACAAGSDTHPLTLARGPRQRRRRGRRGRTTAAYPTPCAPSPRGRASPASTRHAPLATSPLPAWTFVLTQPPTTAGHRATGPPFSPSGPSAACTFSSTRSSRGRPSAPSAARGRRTCRSC